MAAPLLIYVADPMCSWCWGFAPVFAELRARFDGDLEPVLVAGGLRPGTVAPLDDATRAAVRAHWQHVHEATGQPFDFTFFERPSFVYDTEPACRALVAARGLEPGSEFALLGALHEAFYAANRDITDPAVLGEVAAAVGLDPTRFVDVLDEAATRREVAADFALTRRAGIRGFPALLLGGDEHSGLSAVTVGYQDTEPLAGAIAGWLEART